jgi:hypothetical protein
MEVPQVMAVQGEMAVQGGMAEAEGVAEPVRELSILTTVVVNQQEYT